MAIISTRWLKQFTWHKNSSQTHSKSLNVLGYLPNNKEKIRNWIQEIAIQTSQRTQVKIFLSMTHSEKYLTIWNPYLLGHLIKKKKKSNSHNLAGSVNANILDVEHSHWQAHLSVQARKINALFSISLELLQE